MLIGVLSLQGDYHLHVKMLDRLNVDTLLVNSHKTLNKTDALIIPGGESTVISKLLDETGLDKKIQRYSETKSIFGTCAGAILMSSKVEDDEVENLNVINIETLRNSWGRQIHSFTDNVELTFSDEEEQHYFEILT